MWMMRVAVIADVDVEVQVMVDWLFLAWVDPFVQVKIQNKTVFSVDSLCPAF